MKIIMKFIMKILKKTERADTPFSEFIRKASPREKKRVYKRVLEKATERQKEVLRETA